MAIEIEEMESAPSAVSKTPVIEARQVTKVFGEGEGRIEVLKGVDLTVSKGEMLAIMGPSGSGKSTLLGCLSGLDTVSSGQVIVNGNDITKLSENALAGVRNRNIGFVFQTFNLISTLSAQENVELPVMLDAHPRFNPAKRARELLDTVGLSHRRKHRPTQLSGGEQQRVAIARALANDPEIIFADEPTGNLDSVNGEAILSLLTSLKHSTGKTLVIVTHDAGIAAHCDRTVHMQDGSFVDEVA